ncbi:MAG TPA: hypothetical protein VEA37_00220, partial [Flavobacterium sp.]|nr:hypothetical protein [Flavobacterium sp.]
MHRALWIARKNHLCCLIKKVSDGHGGDEVEFLRQHCKDILAQYPNEHIEEAIRCYEHMINQL